jgi:Tol biopolymer transport system component
MHDIARGVTEPFVAEPVSEWAANWTGNGERVLFTSRREGPFRLYTKRANGLGDIEPIWLSDGAASIFGSTPDGHGMLVSTSQGVSVLTMSTNTATVLWTEAGIGNAEISPDGRWIAYAAGAPGARQVWVRPYPDVQTDRWRVSVGGGTSPRWSPDGRTIYYRNGDSMMAVGLRPGPGFSHDEPVKLFDGDYLPDYDIARDGRFLMIKSPAAQPPPDNRIVVVLNWFADLKARLR